MARSMMGFVYDAVVGRDLVYRGETRLWGYDRVVQKDRLKKMPSWSDDLLNVDWNVVMEEITRSISQPHIAAVLGTVMLTLMLLVYFTTCGASASVARPRSRAFPNCELVLSSLSSSEEGGRGTPFPPGLAASDAQLGNLGDIGAAGSLHEFLEQLHREVGPVVSFYWLDKRVVSLASADSWKVRDVQRAPNRPKSLFALFEPLIGSASLQYANDGDLQARKQAYVNPAFSHAAVKSLYDCFAGVAAHTVEAWRALGDGARVPLRQTMITAALRAITLSSLGSAFEQRELDEIADAYHAAWEEMEVRMGGSFPEPGSERERAFAAALGTLHGKARQIVARVRAQQGDGVSEPRSFIEFLMAADVPEQQMLDEVVTVLVGGSHTSGNSLTWEVKALLDHPEYMAELKDELDSVLEPDQLTPTFEQLKQLPFAGKVASETLRWSVLAPWAARYHDEDVEVGPYVVPAGTPVIHALGVVLQDPDVWPDPEAFDPHRFDAEEVKARPRLAFSPFGFAGKRICPGYRYTNVFSTLFLATLVRAFDLELVDPEQDIKRVYGLVTTPSEEIYVRVKARTS